MAESNLHLHRGWSQTGLTHGVMGLDGQQPSPSARASRDAGAALGNRNSSNVQNKRTASRCVPSPFINKGQNADLQNVSPFWEAGLGSVGPRSVRGAATLPKGIVAPRCQPAVGFRVVGAC